MSVSNDFPFAPMDVKTDPLYLRLLRQSINLAMNGKINCTGEVTLTANDTTTVVNNRLCTAKSVVLLTPATANAAADVAAAAGLFVVPDAGFFTITHPNTAGTDKDFRYVIIG
jgi:hypothetical protein